MTEAMIGERVRVTLPYSEVCMHMRVAGRDMIAEVLETGVQLWTLDGERFSFPVGHGEAGIRVRRTEAVT